MNPAPETSGTNALEWETSALHEEGQKGPLARKGICNHGKNILEMSEQALVRSRRDGRDEAGLHSECNTVHIRCLVLTALNSALSCLEEQFGIAGTLV